MIKTSTNKSKNILHVVVTDELTTDDIGTLDDVFEKFVKENDHVPSIVIESDKVPGWENMDAAGAHFNFIRSHQKDISKIAIISDSSLLKILPSFVNIFTHPHIVHFPTSQKAEAIKWASGDGDDTGEFVLIKDLPDEVLGYRLKGIITGKDYQDELVPALHEKLEKYDKINFLLVAGDDLQSYSGSAVWNDIKLGFTDFTSFRKIALVTDHSLLRHGFQLVAWMIPGEALAFSLEDYDDAVKWVSA